MRLVQVSLEPDERAVIDLHPMLSVVQGLDDRSRDRMVRTVAAIAAGVAPPCGGTAEAHGIVLPLDEANLGLLDLRTDADPIVRRADLPGAVAVPSDDEPGSDVGNDPVDTLLRTAPEGRHPALDTARRHHHDTREALRVLRDAAEATARALNEATERRRRLGEALASGGEWSDDRPATQGDAVADLERDLAALDAGIGELASLDIEPVQVLVSQIEDPAPRQDVPSPEAQALADEFVRLHAEVALLEDGMEAKGRGPGSALRRLDAARGAAVEAEAALVRPPVSSDDEEALRQAHEAVLDAEHKASGLRSRSGQRKLAAALTLQQEILDRVGFPTWSAYVMGASLMGVDAAAKARLEAAETELADAEASWAEISSEMEADPDHHALLDQLEEIEVRAVGLLLARGAQVPDERDDLESALRAVRQPIESASGDELVGMLATHLARLGLQLDPDDTERVLTAARALLEEFSGVPVRLEELSNERRRLEGRLVDARSRAEERAWEALEAAVEHPAATDDDLEAALAESRVAEQDLADQMEARHALVEATTLAERSAGRRSRAAALEVLEAEQAEPPESDGEELWAEVDPEAIELYLLARLAALRHVSFAGSVPLVLVDAFRGLDESAVHRVLSALQRMSDSVQIVLLTDDSLAAGWAAGQGEERAAVITVAPAFA